jgi:hypothetical protein
MAELDYYLNDVEYDEWDRYDLADAFGDYADLVLQGKTTAEVRDIYVSVGYAIPVDISKVQVLSGSKYWFKIGSIHYQCLCGWDDWLNK